MRGLLYHGRGSDIAGPAVRLSAGALAGAVIAGMLLVSGLLSIPAIGGRTPFYTRGEPREALVTQTVWRGDGYVLPMRNGDELPSKPPLFHWLGALASAAHGRLSEGTIRFPSLAASLVASAATATAAWLWWGPATAALATVVLVTSFQWLASSVTARVDMVLAATITLALLLFGRAIETGRRVPVAAYALMAAATLTKGPVGFVLPCAIAIVTLALRRELGFLGWRDLRWLGIWVGIAGLWYVAAIAIGGEAFVAKQILKENVFRVLDAEAVEAGHVEPFWYYVPLLAAGLAPWCLFVPGLAAYVWQRRERPAMPPADGVAAAPETPHRLDGHAVFALAWAVVPFVLFSLAGSKRAVYLLPAYPAYAMLIASAWNRVIRGEPGPVSVALLRAGAACSAALLALAAVVIVCGTLSLPLDGWLRGIVSDADVNNVAPMLEATREHRAVVLPCGAAILAAAWTMLRAAARRRWQRVVAATAIAVLALSATVSTTLLPAIAAKRSTRSFLALVEDRVPIDVPLSFYRAFDYGAVFYRRAPIPVRQALSDVPEIHGASGAWLLVWPAFLEDLREEARRLDTGGEAAGAYEVEEAIASEDVDPSDRSSLVLVRIVRRIGDERSDGN